MTSSSLQNSASYAQSGVNIDAGNQLVEMIKPLAKATKRPGADSDLGGFGGIFDLKALPYRDPVLIAATDGVGTKLKIALEVNHHETIGIDLVAMCVNDLVVQNAEPLFFLDYFATSRLDVRMAHSVVKGIAEGCIQAGCSLIGGETAEMPGMYKAGDYDVAGFAVGIAERDQLLPLASICSNDVVIGIQSSGLHSNGYSLVRYLVSQHGLDYQAPAPFCPEKTLGEALLTPTHIYVKTCLAMAKTGSVKAFAHITGGGLLENIPRVLPLHSSVILDGATWQLPPVFQWLAKLGNIPPQEMLRTFNCGIGMVVITPPLVAQDMIALAKENGFEASIIGEVMSKTSEDAPSVECLHTDILFR